MEKRPYSRRQFVKGAAFAVASAGALTACGTDSQASTTTPPPTTTPPKWLPAKWDVETDVVVIGFGAAGAAAAYQAGKAGAKVTILDTSATGGGDTAASGGYVFLGGGTALQKAAGFNETPDQMYTVIRAMGGEGADPDLLKTWCQHGPEIYDFLANVCKVTYSVQDLEFSGMEQHAEFKALAPNGVPVPHCLFSTEDFKGMGGSTLFAKISAAVLAVPGVTLTGLTKAVRLVQDPDTKRVVGVVAKAVDKTGKFVDGAPEQFFKASRGVVIATGAFSKDTAMMARHSPDLLYFNHWAQANADGSGIHMGQNVGGDLRFMKSFWGMNLSAGPAFAKGVLVNPKGYRFVAEDGTFYWLGYHMVARERISYLVTDSSVSPTPPSGAISAASIPELADAINAQDHVGMSGAVLKATLDGYNALANADGVSGSDPAFQKDPQYVLPLTQAPFYAVKQDSKSVQGTTGGGLRVNTQAQLVDTDGNPIPSVYAAGTCCNLTISERYTGSGTAIGGALVFGWLAGQGVAAQTPWQQS